MGEVIPRSDESQAEVAVMRYGMLAVALLLVVGVAGGVAVANDQPGVGTGDAVHKDGQRGHWNLTDEQRMALDQKMKELKGQNATREEIKAAMQDLLKGYGIDVNLTQSGHGARVGSPPFMKPLVLGHGFAIRESGGNVLEYHPLHIDIVGVGKLPPGDVHPFLAQNKTPEEIARKFQEGNRTREARASLRFAGIHYALNVTNQGNDSVEGEILNLAPTGSIPGEVVGHVSLTIANYEGERVVTGSITINGESYDVLLSSPLMPPPEPRKFGAQGPGRWAPEGNFTGRMKERRENASRVVGQ